MKTFADKVYDATRKIPHGKVATYGDIASYIGQEGASRAVGNALHLNPFAPVVPCHRVVNSKGQLAHNFGNGGAEGQQKLLEKEGIVFEKKGVVPLHRYQYYLK